MEEGGWKLLLVIDTENLCKIRSAKKRDQSILYDLHNFPLPAPNFKSV